MKRLLMDWGLAILVGFLVFLIADNLGGAKDSGPAPDFTLINVAGGTTSLDEYAGKTVVINFWGSWCPPCREEIPAFSAWSTANPETPVLGIAVRSGGSEAVAQKAKSLGITYTVLVADDQVVDDYSIDVYPTTVIIRPDGSIGGVYQGAMDAMDLSRAVAQAGS